jgi:hypothetical protein
MTIQQFAEEHKLKVTRDECGDEIILGRHGQLYTDDGELCAVWTDARPIKRDKLVALGGRMWQGDVSLKNGRRVQDAWVKGIQPKAYTAAIRLVGAAAKRELSPEHRAKLVAAGTQSLENYRRLTLDMPKTASESSPGLEGLPRHP